jgi:Ca2+-transporting ATPase
MDEDGVRTQVFITLVVANIVLTLVNRSFRHSILTTLAYRNPLIRGILLATVLLLLALLYVPALRDFFQLTTPTGGQQVVAVLLGLGSVVWYEGVKGWKRHTEAA